MHTTTTTTITTASQRERVINDAINLTKGLAEAVSHFCPDCKIIIKQRLRLVSEENEES